MKEQLDRNCLSGRRLQSGAMSLPTAILVLVSMRPNTPTEESAKTSKGPGFAGGSDASRRQELEIAADQSEMTLKEIPVASIRPEEGLGRRREREGHEELCRSISQFGVLTPITVRRAEGQSEEYLLVKGQGRTLACRRLGIEHIPAHVMSNETAESEKVSQFLVENIARLRMRPVDRALLVMRARQQGEETAQVARRFGISAATVRRLDSQLNGAGPGELKALRSGDLSLALQAVITKRVRDQDREAFVKAIGGSGVRAQEMNALLTAFGWEYLDRDSDSSVDTRMELIRWACQKMALLPRMTPFEKIREIAAVLPREMPSPQKDREVS
jgi:ParB/RepB/Spo0J family partition protein